MPMLREEKSPEEKWNLENFFTTPQAWEENLEALQQKAKAGWDALVMYQGKIKAGDPQALKELLDIYFAYCRDLEKVYVYAHLRHDEDIGNDTNRAGYERSIALLQMFEHAASWIEPEILSMDEERLQNLMKAQELSGYRFYLQTLFDQKPYVLDEKGEYLMALASPIRRAPSSAFSALNNVDMKFPDVLDAEGKAHPLTHGTYSVYLKSHDRILRENAFKGMHRTFRKMENTLTGLLSGQVQSHIFTKKARGYDSCLESALKRYQIPTQVYYNLIEATRRELDALHEYVALRKKLLGYGELHYYDLSVPLVKQVDMKFSYQESCQITIDSVALLGEEYQEILRKGITEDQWVDVSENEGKRSGAYSSGCYDSMPYILLNYQGMLNDLMTLSHEAGHSMNTLLSNRKQAYHEASYPIFVAEVASTFHEQLTLEYLLERAKSREERLYLLNHAIESIRGTFFRQTMFAEFELKIHQLAEDDHPLTKDLLKELYAELNRDYFGPELVIDDELSSEFSRIPHFYYNFYVYQYATGIAAATTLVDLVKKEGNEAYLNFLSSGGSDYPIPTLKKAGVDMENAAVIHHQIARFRELVKKFEKEIV